MKPTRHLSRRKGSGKKGSARARTTKKLRGGVTRKRLSQLTQQELLTALEELPVLTAQELIALREKDDAKVIVVDVRTEAERRVARLPRSVSRCYFEKALRLNADAASLRGVKIVVICTVGRRSGNYARQLLMRGCEHVFNSQGIVAYSHHHLASGAGPHALVDEEGRPATRLHVYARPWDLGSERFESVRFGLVGAARAAMFG